MINHKKSFVLILGTLAFSLFGFSSVLAESSSSDNVSVSVPVSCSITRTINTVHSATVDPGTYEDEIGESTFNVFCNDYEGFAVYAIGYSGDSYGDNTMIPNNINSSYSIASGTATSGNTSNWAMKLTAVSGDFAPTLATGFNAYHAVPDEYTKVASLAANTDATNGSSFKSTYVIYITDGQPADTYTGKVKYTVLHPSSASAPLVCRPEGTTISTIACMQDISSTNKTSVAESMVPGTQYTLVDKRDGKEYKVAKLSDYNIWMVQNLDLNIDSNKTYTSADTDILADWTPSSSTHPQNDLTWNNSTTAPESYDPGDIFWNGIVDAGQHTDPSDYISNSGNPNYHFGNYYNPAAALATNNINVFAEDYDDDDYEFIEIDQSICPSGWKLPKGLGDDYDNPPNGSFFSLFIHYGWNTINYPVTSPYIWESEAKIALVGSYHGNSTNNSQIASSGWLIDSTYVRWGNSINEGYGVQYDYSGYVYPADYAPHYLGRSVRCLVR